MRIDVVVNMVPPEASACMLWGGMSSCGLRHQNNNCQDRLVLRSAPHVLRRGRYVYVAAEYVYTGLVQPDMHQSKSAEEFMMFTNTQTLCISGASCSDCLLRYEA